MLSKLYIMLIRQHSYCKMIQSHTIPKDYMHKSIGDLKDIYKNVMKDIHRFQSNEILENCHRFPVEFSKPIDGILDESVRHAYCMHEFRPKD